MEYIAAEYFIEVVGNTSNFCVNYDCIPQVINQAAEDIALYLKKEGDGNFLFIFKKFPDVFILTGSVVTLTDVFLSLYTFPDSSTFLFSNACANIFEVEAIEYFKLILIRCGTCHYNLLFDALLSHESLNLTPYFSNYTTKEKYSFFQNHSNTFAVLNDSVHLKETLSLIGGYPIVCGKYTNCIKRLSKAVYFLLLCFESLHYIALKQCISYAIHGVKKFLNQYSLIKQREIFQCLQKASMDEWGYVTLKQLHVPKTKSPLIRQKLFIVCILAFKKEMHFSKIVEEAKVRWVGGTKRTILELSEQDQKLYFYRNRKLFVMHTTGYVNLQPSFIFPLSFDNSYSLQISQHLKTLNISICEPGRQNIEFFKKNSDAEVTSQNFNSCLNVKMQNLQLNFDQTEQKFLHDKDCSVASTVPSQSVASANNKLDDFDRSTENSLEYSKIISYDIDSDAIKDTREQKVEISTVLCDKLISSVIFLKSCFLQPATKDILETILHTLHSVKTYFSDLTPKNQHKLILKCFQFIECANEIFPLGPHLNIPPLIKEEECLLFITYLLMKLQSVHYRKIKKKMIKFQLTAPFTSIEDKHNQDSVCLKYLQSLSEYFFINADGWVRLSSTFSHLSSVIGSLLSCSGEIQKKMNFCLNTQSEASSMYNKVLNVSHSISQNTGNLKNEVENVVDCTNSIEFYRTSDIIIDICFYVLTVCRKMEIIELCDHLKSCNIINVQNYFSFHTVDEKLKFFSCLSQHFDVSQDRFVSLKGDVIQTYVPKTKYIKKDSNGQFVFCNTNTSQFLNHPKDIETCDSSDLSDSSSNLSSTSSFELSKTQSTKKVKLSQIKKDPTTIKRANSLLGSNSNENIDNSCSESTNNLSLNRIFNTTLSDNTLCDSENSNMIEQMHQQENLTESDVHNKVQPVVNKNLTSDVPKPFEKRETITLAENASRNEFDFSDIEYESFLAHGTELLNLFLGQLDSDTHV